MTEFQLQILPSGDSAILVKFGNIISEAVNQKVHDLKMMIDSMQIKGIEEMVPAYTDLLITYNPLIISYKELLSKINEATEKPREFASQEKRLIKIPVCYDEDLGFDLEEVSEYTGLSKTEIIKIHSSATYLVYMLGFTPGFCYLGGMDEKIACPRKKIPRQDIPAGSLGIADKQTGIYPIESPGGWQIIGRTPLNLFDPSRKEIFLCQAGDMVQFEQITREQFESIKEKHSS